MIEREVQIPAEGASLAGTLCLPAGPGPFPTVLMIHGSGPLDRDENVKGQRLNVFNTLAHHLAAEGIASLRYDKRGCGKSTGDYLSAGHYDLVADAGACFEFLTRSAEVRKERVYALGHSEGCLIAPQLSLKYPGLAGAILLCPLVGKVEEAIRKQQVHGAQYLADMKGITGMFYRWLAGDQRSSLEKFLAKIKATDAAVIRSGLQRFPAKCFREMFALELARIFEQVRCPILVIGGEKDLQSPPADVHEIARLAKGPVEAHVMKDLTHTLRLDSESPSYARYEQLIKLPLESSVLQLVSAWVRTQTHILPLPPDH